VYSETDLPLLFGMHGLCGFDGGGRRILDGGYVKD